MAWTQDTADIAGHVQDRTGASQLLDSVPQLTAQLDRDELEPALLQLLARLAELSSVPYSANVRDEDGLGQSQARSKPYLPQFHSDGLSSLLRI